MGGSSLVEYGARPSSFPYEQHHRISQQRNDEDGWAHPLAGNEHAR
jgi:hypothetical protein